MDKNMIYTPFGKGQLVCQFADGSVCVRFSDGTGRIFRASELNLSRKEKGSSDNRTPILASAYGACVCK